MIGITFINEVCFPLNQTLTLNTISIWPLALFEREGLLFPELHDLLLEVQQLAQTWPAFLPAQLIPAESGPVYWSSPSP